MERNIFWKSVIRRRGSLFLFVALMLTASFGFTLRAVEYLSVTGEIARISKNYRPIGELYLDGTYYGDEAFDQTKLLEGTKLLEESPYLDCVNQERVGGALLSDLYNADLDGFSSGRESGGGTGVRTNDILVWAYVEDVKNTTTSGNFRYGFRVEEPLSGYPDYMMERNKLIVYLDSRQVDGTKEPLMEEGKTYLIRGCYSPYKNASRGNVLRFDLLPLAEGLWFLEGQAGGDASAYLDSDAEVQERNRHAMRVITAVDMSMLPSVQDAVSTMHLEAGRWLNREDYEKKKPVCVIAQEFAAVRELQVGDTLRMSLLGWDSAVSYSGYVADGDDDSWRDCEHMDVELEIVGVYSPFYADMPEYLPPTSYSNSFYIPDSLVPESYYGTPEWQESVSFVLDSPKVQEAFVQETKEALDALGVTCSFVESEWETYFHSAEEIARGARYSLLLFSAVMVCALALVAFLYTWQRKKEIAIARALGAGRGAVSCASCLPMLFFGAIAILVGGISAWRYGLVQAEKTLAAVEAGAHAQVSLLWLAALVFSLWLALLVFLFAGSFLCVRRPVLEILQGSPARAAGAGARRQNMPAAEPIGDTKDARQAVPEKGGGMAEPVQRYTTADQRLFPVMAWFLWHQIAHISLRPLCVLLAAIVFVAASGWLRESIVRSEKKLDDLYGSTVVEASISRANTKVIISMTEDAGAYIYPATIQRILDSGFVVDAYLETGKTNRIGKWNGNTGHKRISFLGITDAEQFAAIGRGPQIQYGDGYGPELFATECEITADGGLTSELAVILPESLWEKWEVKPGDLLVATDEAEHMITSVRAAGYYTGTVENVYEDVVLVPQALQDLLNLNVNYLTARFTLDSAKNRELDTFVEMAEKTVENPDAGELALSFTLWDSELRQVVEPMERNVGLMKLLYPIANLVSFLIAGGLAVLLLFQRRREAAILRVLGVGVLPVRITLAFELFLLNLIGILLGLAVIAAVTGTADLPAMGIAAGAYFAGGLLGAAVGAGLVTNVKPIALLQVKE